MCTSCEVFPLPHLSGLIFTVAREGPNSKPRYKKQERWLPREWPGATETLLYLHIPCACFTEKRETKLQIHLLQELEPRNPFTRGRGRQEGQVPGLSRTGLQAALAFHRRMVVIFKVEVICWEPRLAIGLLPVRPCSWELSARRARNLQV